jgi:hypothetical protein
MKLGWHTLSVLLAFLSACNDDSGTKPTPQDTTPPAGVEDLATGSPRGGALALTWTAPGDDGMAGRAAQYSIRYSAAPLTESRWDSAAAVDSQPAPKPAGETESFALLGLGEGTWYVGLKSADEVPNWSVLSNVVSTTVAAPDTVPPSPVSDLTGVSATSTSVTLSWTAPGDDSTWGWPSAYDLRYALATITEETWGDATRVSGLPAPDSAGSQESCVVTDLRQGTDHFFALKATDEVWNWSELSNVASLATLPDAIPPSRVADLAAVSATTGAATLTWTAPGNDGSDGRASIYDLRYALTSITDETWDEAARVDGVPAPRSAGDPESFVVTGLAPVTEYFFALKAADEAANWSELSNVASESTVSLARLTDSPGATSGAYLPKWSPNGRVIAFYANWVGGQSQIYLISVGGGEAVQFTADPVAALFPSWSPDATRLAFVSRQNNGLWIMDAVPFAEASLLVSVPDPDQYTVSYSSWSPDGSHIAYSFATWAAPTQIFIVPSEGGPSELLVGGLSDNARADWSPDGSQIAFVSDRSGNYDLWVVPADGGEVTQLTFDPESDTWPAWSPDGSRIAFASKRAGTGNYDLWVMSATGANPTQLTFNPGEESGPSWSLEGNQIAFHANEPHTPLKYDIWTIAVPGP